MTGQKKYFNSIFQNLIAALLIVQNYERKVVLIFEFTNFFASFFSFFIIFCKR